MKTISEIKQRLSILIRALTIMQCAVPRRYIFNLSSIMKCLSQSKVSLPSKIQCFNKTFCFVHSGKSCQGT